MHLLRISPLLLLLLAAAGCSTIGRQLAYDNTVEIAKHPLNDTLEIGWRVKTFWTEEFVSYWRRYISFPLLTFSGIPELSQSGEMNPEILVKWLQRKTGAPVDGDVDLLLNGDTFFPRFSNTVAAATNRIDLKTYIFDNDDVAKKYADQLKARSLNIPVRILYDTMGTRMAWRANAPSLPDDFTYEVDDMIRYLAADSKIQLSRSKHKLLTSEHSKYFLIDNTAFFGGMNIGREYRFDWRDAMFQLNGPVINSLNTHFEKEWRHAVSMSRAANNSSNGKQPDDSQGSLYLVSTTPFHSHIYKSQLRAIKNATQRIYIENPYLWNQPVLYQLCAARKRGVDVRVTIPREVNHGIGVSANKRTVKYLLRHGVRVFIYPGMTHVKAAVYDNWACFGSANFDDLSLHKNYELNIFTDQNDVVNEIAEELLIDGQKLSTEIFEPDTMSWREFFLARFSQYL